MIDASNIALKDAKDMRFELQDHVDGIVKWFGTQE